MIIWVHSVFYHPLVAICQYREANTVTLKLFYDQETSYFVECLFTEFRINSYLCASTSTRFAPQDLEYSPKFEFAGPMDFKSYEAVQYN